MSGESDNSVGMIAPGSSGDAPEIYFMRLALTEAKKALYPEANCGRYPEVPVGCVFVNYETSEIIGRGFNLTNTEYNATRHAEMVAIDDILIKQGRHFSVFSECDLYVTCEPCIMCAAALSKLSIRRVLYGCSNERFGGNGSVLNVHKRNVKTGGQSTYEVVSGIMENDAIALFQTFYSLENSRAPEEKRKRKLDCQNTSAHGDVLSDVGAIKNRKKIEE